MKKRRKSLSLVLFCCSIVLFSQTPTQPNDVDRALKIGEILVNGLSILKANKTPTQEQTDSKTVSSVCFKNKLTEKLTIKLQGTFVKKEDEAETEQVKKELVIQPDTKECLYDLQKGVWDYEFIKVTNNEVYKKGQHKVEEEITITVDK